MLRNELLIQKQMCKQDQIENPALYKVNGMSVAQMKVNLGVLLSGNHEKDLEGTVVFPDESPMLSILDDPNYEVAVHKDSSNVEEHEIPFNEPCAEIWDNPNGREWFIGMARERISKDEFLIDYLSWTRRTQVRSFGGILIKKISNKPKQYKSFHAMR